jgi:hypothetical protein
MKTNIFYLFIGIVIGALILRNCSSENTTIQTPEIVGKFTDTIIKHKSIKIPFEVPKWYKDTQSENKLKNDLLEYEKRIKLYEEEVSYIISDFQNSDSLHKLELFKKCNELKNFEKTFEDANIIINTQGVIRGEVKEITNIYKIKSQSIQVPINEKIFSLNAGIGTDFNATTPVLKLGVGYKNYKIDYLKINSQDFGVLSYEIKF